jgi:hypothetical protein
LIVTAVPPGPVLGVIDVTVGAEYVSRPIAVAHLQLRAVSNTAYSPATHTSVGSPPSTDAPE